MRLTVYLPPSLAPSVGQKGKLETNGNEGHTKGSRTEGRKEEGDGHSNGKESVTGQTAQTDGRTVAEERSDIAVEWMDS